MHPSNLPMEQAIVQLEASFQTILETLKQVSTSIEESERTGGQDNLLKAKTSLLELKADMDDLEAQNEHLALEKDKLILELQQSILRNAELAHKLAHLAQLQVRRSLPAPNLRPPPSNRDYLNASRIRAQATVESGRKRPRIWRQNFPWSHRLGLKRAKPNDWKEPEDALN